jgi:outer membrane protein assembly factor BamB
MTLPNRSSLAAAAFGVFALAGTAAVFAGDWSRFRGPHGLGVSDEKNIPVKVEPGNVLWKVSLPAFGHSSAAVAGDDVFITGSPDGGKTRLLLCLSAKDGSTRWKVELPGAVHSIHKKSSFASATPCVDGRLVYITFTVPNVTVWAFDRADGREVWKRELGEFISEHGSGTSPIVYRDLLILSNDQGGTMDPKGSPRDGKSFLIALDAATGATRWQTDRKTAVVSYSTPLVIEETGKRPELIFTSQAEGIVGLDPLNGKVNWQVPGFTKRTVGSAVYADGVIAASCGQGSGGSMMIGVAGGKSVWQAQKMLPYVPSPVGFGRHFYVVSDGGVAGCFEARSGKPLWSERLGGNFAAGALVIDGKVYAISEQGEMFVFAAAEQYKLIARSSVDEPVYATPSVANGRLYIRTHKSLICLGNR